MRRLTFFVLCLLVCCLGIAYAELDDQSPETDAMHEIKADETMAAIEMGGNIEGMVVNVSPVSGTLAIRDAEEDDKLYYLSVKKATTYAGVSSISDINPGDSISVDCYSLSGHLVAETVTLQDRAYQDEKPAPLEKMLVD